ncbi:MAG: Tim44 domain-containing protein, partial [Longicatena sp.]
CVCIRGKMVDFKIDEVEEVIIEGDKRSHEFFEYWKFIRKDNTILLDEVRQKDELDLHTLVDLSEELHDEDDTSSLRNH